MEHLFQYTLAVSVPLMILWIAYRWAIADIKRPAANRLTLITIYAVSLTLVPLMRLSGFFPTEFYIIGYDSGNSGEDSSLPSILTIASAVWVAGAAVCLLLSIADVVRILTTLRRCKSVVSSEGWPIHISDDDNLSPFSFGSVILMNRRDYDECRRTILLHEVGHIRNRHILDLMLSQTVAVLCWYNPAAWLMRRELKTVHEFQADAHVVNAGCDILEYQLLLLQKSVLSHHSAIASNLNYSQIRRRISMINRPAPTRRSLWRYTVPLAGMTCAAATLTIDSVSYAVTPQIARSVPAVEPPKTSKDHPEVYVNGDRIPYEDINSVPVSEIKAITINKSDDRTEIVISK